MFENSFIIKAKTEAISLDSLWAKFSPLSFSCPFSFFWPLLISSEFINHLFPQKF